MQTTITAAFAVLEKVRETVHKVIVGQNHLIDRLLIALLCDGHVLLEGVPGIAKTLTVKTFATTLGLTFKRIQFTPDLLPGDLTGTMIYLPQEKRFEPRKGPIFAQMVLADEVNRSPAKVQSALLEAMQERQVTIGDTTFPLPKPFLVLATQNPIDQEGTYPLPEAQIDRFLMKVHVSYPSKEEELQILQRMAKTHLTFELEPQTNAQEIQQMQHLINQVELTERLQRYIVNLVDATRHPSEYGLKELQPYIAYGASPRGTIALALCAKAHALLRNDTVVLPEDVKAVAFDVLNHRIIRSYEAQAEGISEHTIINTLLDKIPY